MLTRTSAINNNPFNATGRNSSVIPINLVTNSLIATVVLYALFYVFLLTYVRIC